MNAGCSAITLLVCAVSACGFAPHQTAGDDDTTPQDASVVSDAPMMVFMDSPPQTELCDATDPQLVACYQFENNLIDESSHHNNGTTTAVSYATGKVGKALFVGTTTGIDIANSSSFDVADLTIEAWIYPFAIPTNGNRGGILDREGPY